MTEAVREVHERSPARAARAGWRQEAGWLADALRAEWFKVARRRMTYICLGVFAMLVVLFYVVLWLRVREGPGDNPFDFQQWVTFRAALSFRNVDVYGFALERFFATLVCVIFTGTMIGNEYDWRTVGLVTGRGVRRWHFLTAKLVSGILFTVVCVALGLLAAIAASAWFTVLYDLPWGGFGVARLLDAGLSLLRTVFVIVPFAVLSLYFATVWRSAGPAVGAALGVFFLEGIFITLLNTADGWVNRIPDLFLSVNIDAVMRANGTFASDGGPFLLAPGGPSAWRGAAVVLAWTVVLALGAYWRFQRRDIQE